MKNLIKRMLMPSIHKNASEKEAVGFSSASEGLRGLC